MGTEDVSYDIIRGNMLCLCVFWDRCVSEQLGIRTTGTFMSHIGTTLGTLGTLGNQFNLIN